MTIEDLQKLAHELPAVTEDIKWENHLCFCVGGKIICMLGLDEHPVTASIKVANEEYAEWSARPGFKQAPYMARNKWVWMDDISRLSAQEWRNRLRVAYDLKKAALTRKVRKELGIDNA